MEQQEAARLPPNPYREDTDAGTYHHPTVNAAPTMEESSNAREGAPSSSRASQNLAEGNSHIPCGPPVHWKKRVFEPSPTQEKLDKAARKKRPTIWGEAQLEENVSINRDIWQGGLKGQNPPGMNREDEQPLQTHVWDEAEWYQEGDERNTRYAYFQNAGPSQQKQKQPIQHTKTLRGQQDVWYQECDEYQLLRSPKAKITVTTPFREMLPGPSDGTAMGELLKRTEVQKKIKVFREENVTWEFYDKAKADQPHLQGSPLSKSCKNEEFLVTTEDSLLCEVCLVKVNPLERGFHVGLRSHMIKVQCMKEEQAWFEDV